VDANNPEASWHRSKLARKQEATPGSVTPERVEAEFPLSIKKELQSVSARLYSQMPHACQSVASTFVGKALLETTIELHAELLEQTAVTVPEPAARLRGSLEHAKKEITAKKANARVRSRLRALDLIGGQAVSRDSRAEDLGREGRDISAL
jgi:hypothetical protein